MGEGFSGTTMKDTWTKLRGALWKQGREVGLAGGRAGWGLNADKCN